MYTMNTIQFNNCNQLNFHLRKIDYRRLKRFFSKKKDIKCYIMICTM